MRSLTVGAVCVLLIGAVASGDGVTPGGVTFIWDPETLLLNENHLETSIPAMFAGADVAPIVGASTYHNAGVTGGNTISTNIEAGHIWNGHETLGHVVSFSNHANAPNPPFAVPATDRHATWVGMMIGGRNGGAFQGPWQPGIAPQSDLRSGAIATTWVGGAYSLSFGATALTLDFPYSSAISGFGTADVINSSWGSAPGSPPESTGMDLRSLTTDSLGNGNPLTTFVVSAGNNGPGANTIGAPGSGYNGITVAALENNGANLYQTIAAFSSRGPQDYGDPVNGTIPQVRAAIDIAAPGTHLVSAYYGGQSGGNDASLAGSPAGAPGGPNWYSSGLAGTSFAAPITAGGVALMDSAAKAGALPATARDARVVKANLLNAAARPAALGWNNGQVAHPNGNGGVQTAQSLDWASGAGALDLDRTYTQQLTGETDLPGLNGGVTNQVVGWDYATVALGGSTDIVIAPTLQGDTEFRATLAWFRERTYNGVGNVTDVGFADLNLEIWDSTFTTLYSDSISPFNPVEHLTFDLPVTGTYGIRVAYPANVFGNITTEEFGLAWYGVPEPASLSLLALGALALLRRRREG